MGPAVHVLSQVCKWRSLGSTLLLGLRGQLGGGCTYTVLKSFQERQGRWRESPDFGKGSWRESYGLPPRSSLVSCSLAASHHGKAGETAFHEGEWGSLLHLLCPEPPSHT